MELFTKKSDHLLAIIVPYYKIDFFRECLESLAAQTDKRFTVYIGNDASPEDPTDLLHEFEGKFNFTYKKFDNNLGGTSLTKQWERCIEMLQNEEWLMILGDDDCLTKNVVSDFYENLAEINDTCNVVRFSTQIINDKNEAISEVFKQPKFENPINSYQRKLLGYNRSSLSEYIFKVTKYRKYGFKNYPLGWSSDDRATIDICDRKDIYSINTAVIKVRMSPLNISSTNRYSKLMQKAILQSTRELILDYKENMDKAQLRFFIQNYENSAFSFKKVASQDIINLIKLFLCYMPFKSKIYIIKAVIPKILN